MKAGADIVSSYIWRGLYLGPASIQPSVSLSPEISRLVSGDLPVFRVTERVRPFCRLFHRKLFCSGHRLLFPPDLPDGEGSSYFKLSEHLFEATLGYSFGESLPLSLAWNTNFAGDDDHSSYMEASYSIPAGEVTIDLILGATPWAGMYSDGFALINASIKASKEIHHRLLFTSGIQPGSAESRHKRFFWFLESVFNHHNRS